MSARPSLMPADFVRLSIATAVVAFVISEKILKHFVLKSADKLQGFVLAMQKFDSAMTVELGTDADIVTTEQSIASF